MTGNRRADRSLEAELDAALRRSREELRPRAGDELLVRRHDRSTAAQQLEHVVARRLDPAHDLRDEGDLGGRRGSRAKSSVRRPSGAACSRSRDGSRTSARTTRRRWPVARSISSALVLEQPMHRRADGSVAEQRDGNVDSAHAFFARRRAGRARRRSRRRRRASRARASPRSSPGAARGRRAAPRRGPERARAPPGGRRPRRRPPRSSARSGPGDRRSHADTGRGSRASRPPRAPRPCRRRARSRGRRPRARRRSARSSRSST